MFDESGGMGGEDDPDTDYDEGAIRFGSIQRDVTDFTKMYSTSTGDMTRDLDDPYAFEKKPLHYIPGYTGHLPLNRERFGINYREASADTINMQKKKGVHNPVVPLDKPPPNHSLRSSSTMAMVLAPIRSPRKRRSVILGLRRCSDSIGPIRTAS